MSKEKFGSGTPEEVIAQIGGVLLLTPAQRFKVVEEEAREQSPHLFSTLKSELEQIKSRLDQAETSVTTYIQNINRIQERISLSYLRERFFENMEEALKGKTNKFDVMSMMGKLHLSEVEDKAFRKVLFPKKANFIEAIADYSGDLAKLDKFALLEMMGKFKLTASEKEFCIEQLVAKGLDLSAPIEQGYNILTAAAKLGDQELVKAIINIYTEENPDLSKEFVNQLDINGLNALHVAAIEGNDAMVRALLDTHNADPLAKSDKSLNFVQLSKQYQSVAADDKRAIDNILKEVIVGKKNQPTKFFARTVNYALSYVGMDAETQYKQEIDAAKENLLKAYDLVLDKYKPAEHIQPPDISYMLDTVLDDDLALDKVKANQRELQERAFQEKLSTKKGKARPTIEVPASAEVLTPRAAAPSPSLSAASPTDTSPSASGRSSPTPRSLQSGRSSPSVGSPQSEQSSPSSPVDDRAKQMPKPTVAQLIVAGQEKGVAAQRPATAVPAAKAKKRDFLRENIERAAAAAKGKKVAGGTLKAAPRAVGGTLKRGDVPAAVKAAAARPSTAKKQVDKYGTLRAGQVKDAAGKGTLKKSGAPLRPRLGQSTFVDPKAALSPDSGGSTPRAGKKERS